MSEPSVQFESDRFDRSGRSARRPARLLRRVRKLVWLLARPVRRGRREREQLIQPYRGFGSPERIFLMGRVLSQPPGLQMRDRLANDLLDVGRRLFRRGIAGVTVEARIGAAHATALTDRDGYFRLDLDLGERPLPGSGWHHAELGLVGRADSSVMARAFVHRRSCRCLVVSDIDDTVVETGVANRIVMLWRLFAKGPDGRLPVPGIAEFYRALNRGRTGTERNPVIFVSRAPWTIYETLDAFFRLHRMPGDAVLFLREWGVRWHHPFARRDRDHKLNLIRRLLETAPTLPVVLVGDSGQTDAEIYARIVEDFPGRVSCVLIRDLAQSATREQELRALARRLEAAGARFVLTPSTRAMAEVADELELIQPEALASLPPGEGPREAPYPDGKAQPFRHGADVQPLSATVDHDRR